MANPAMPQRAHAHPTEPTKASDLDVAIRVAQRMLATYGGVGYGDLLAYAQAHGALTASLCILLHALGADPVDEEEAARRSVDRAFPAVAAFLADDAEQLRDGGQA